jgi:hypothetical protein
VDLTERDFKVDLVSFEPKGDVLITGSMRGGMTKLRLTRESWRRVVESVEWAARQGVHADGR